MKPVKTEFPEDRPQRDDTTGYLVVQRNLRYLRDVYDKLFTKLFGGSVDVHGGLVDFLAGTTTVTVIHNLGITNYFVVAMPATPLPNTIAYYSSNRLANSFDLNLNPASVLDQTLHWIIKVDLP